jgi:hypothetical protein
MEEDKTDRAFPKAVFLPSRRFGNIEQHLRMFIDEHGAVVLEGQDLGRGVQEILPTSEGECEYWLTLPAEYKDWVLLNLIQERFSGDAEKPLDTLFREWLEERNIPHKSFSYY